MKQYYSERDLEQMRRQSDEIVEDITKIHEDVQQYKTVPAATMRKDNARKGREKQLEKRYKTVRAPYKKKDKGLSDKLQVFKSEKKARKDPNYELLKNEDL